MSLDMRMNSKEPFSWETQIISQKYNQQIPVSNAKKKDLFYLLKTGVIPQAYTHFIFSIPTSDSARVVVPYAIEEEGEDDGPKCIEPELTRTKRRTKQTTKMEEKKNEIVGKKKMRGLKNVK